MMETKRGAGKKAGDLVFSHSQALEPSWASPLAVLVKLAVCSAQWPAAPEQCITVGPVFRQSDRSQPEHLENPGNQRPMHTSPPANIYILSLSLSACLFCAAILVCVSSSFPTWNLFPHFSLCFTLSPPSFSPGPPSTPLSLILSCFSLCLSLPLLLRFNKSPGGRREKTGGCKNIYGFIYKGPRYCPALNPGEMIYFPPMCGTDPRGVTQQWTGFVLAIYGGCRGS